MFGFGTGPFGTMSFGTMMAPLVSILRALVVAENRVRLDFVVAPRATNLGECGDAYDPAHFRLTPIETSIDRRGEPPRPVTVVAVERVDPTTLDLLTDRAFSSFGALYLLDVDGLVDESGDPLAFQQFTLLGVHKGIPEIRRDRIYNNRDFAFQDPDGQGQGGGVPLAENHDMAVVEGLAAWKMRVARCITTRKGTVAHLPDYGMTALQSIKRLGKASVRDQLAIEAEEQIRREPETISCTVAVVPSTTPGLFFYRIKAQTIFGVQEVTVPVPTE